ncbi:MAG: Hpt domain-containing protein [Acidobacteriota bacterium]|nr:Hpt domain-containing protein [Acidobacteriota bacterium]
MLESLDSSILFAFTEEAQSYLPDIRRAVAIDAAAEDLQLAFRHTHTIKGASMMVGLNEISELAGKIEAVFESCANGETVLDETSVNQLSLDVDLLEIALGEMVSALVVVTNKQIINSFSDAAALKEEMERESAFADQKPDEQFDNEELDPEMLEVFAEEAADLLQNIGENVKALEGNPQNAVGLGEIRRSSHTLKGAAAVCGFRTVSRIAHRLEDLLDSLAENLLDSNAETTALILLTTDLLERLTRGESEFSLKTEIERLFERFDQTLSRQVPDVETETLLPEKSYEQDNEKSSNIESKNEYFASPETMPTTLAPNGTAVKDEIGNEEDSTFNAHPSSVKKAVVRVGIDRLDELVKLVGEIIISRNALEQRLTQIESQLGEMNRNTRRLKNISGRLETDYELKSFLHPGKFANGFSPNFTSAQPFSGSDDNTKHGFDTLEFDRYTEFHQLTRELAETASDASGISSELEDLIGNLEIALSRQRRTTEEIQERLMRLRMVPLNTLAARLERTVRVTAEQENKLADFLLEGGETEIDTQVLDSLTEPLLHLLRNSIAHGIESPEERMVLGKPPRGAIRLSVIHEGTHIVFTVSDDGRGLDFAALRKKAAENSFLDAAAANALTDDETAALVFLPGLSTAKKVSEVSGRGVGMDAVRQSVERQQGTIAIKSKPGAGTAVTIRLPMSLAVTRALLVKSSSSIFAVPVATIRQLTETTANDFEETPTGKILHFNEKTYQHYSLNRLLNLPELIEKEPERIPTIILNNDENAVALTFDRTLDAREVVIKPFDSLLRRVRGLLGATVLGDGSVVPILDLFDLINRRDEKEFIQKTITEEKTSVFKSGRLSVMIVDDSTSVRRVMTNLIAKTGWQAIAAKDGIEALEMLQNSAQMPDVILSDVEMPRMDGYEFVAALAQQNALKQIPVVMITSRAGEKHRRKALEMGVAEYITKPYQDTLLLETIKKLSLQR